VVSGEWSLNPYDRNKEFFSDLEDKDLQMHIDMGDDGRYSVTKSGLLPFIGILILPSH